MAIEFNGTKLKVITFNGTDITNVTLNNSTIWCKPFTLTITTSGQIDRYFVTRAVTNEPFATVGETVHNGGTLYYGDSIKIEATAASGHKLNGTFPYTIENIKDNVSVSISASPILYSPSFEPNIYGQRIGNTVNAIVAEISIINTNVVGVTCNYKITGVSVAGSDVREGTTTIEYKSNRKVSESFKQYPFITQVIVEASFESDTYLTPVYSETVKQTFTVNV